MFLLPLSSAFDSTAAASPTAVAAAAPQTPPRKSAFTHPASPPRTPPPSNHAAAAGAGLLGSPDNIKSPMRYHYYEDVVGMSKKALKGFEGKPHHTLASPSTEGHAAAIKKHYAEIRFAKKKRKLLTDLGEPVDPSKPLVVQTPGASIKIESDGYVVEKDGKRRAFGQHRNNSKGVPILRLYPKATDGTDSTQTLPGAEVLRLRAKYSDLLGQSKGDSPTFQQFVTQSVREAQQQMGAFSSFAAAGGATAGGATAGGAAAGGAAAESTSSSGINGDLAATASDIGDETTFVPISAPSPTNGGGTPGAVAVAAADSPSHASPMTVATSPSPNLREINAAVTMAMAAAAAAAYSDPLPLSPMSITPSPSISPKPLSPHSVTPPIGKRTPDAVSALGSSSSPVNAAGAKPSASPKKKPLVVKLKPKAAAHSAAPATSVPVKPKPAAPSNNAKQGKKASNAPSKRAGLSNPKSLSFTSAGQPAASHGASGFKPKAKATTPSS